MFLLRLLRFLQGYVRFRAQGVFVERFLNLIARDRISVWDGRKRGDTYTGCARASSYRRMRSHAKKTGVKLRIAGKEGAPFQRRKYRKRVGLLIGIGLFAAFLSVMSGFIWRVEVSGNEKLEDSEIIQALEDIGVGAGVWRSSIQVRESERLAMLRLEDLSWIALNIEGSTIHVEVSERTPPPKMLDPHVPCNIVASHTGYIVRMQVYEGQAMLKEGDTVMAGEVIVSGITEDRLGQNLFRHAYADVYAEIQQSFAFDIPLDQILYIENGKTTRRKYLQFSVFDLPIHLPGGIPQPYRVERERVELEFLGIPLPFSMLTEEYILMDAVPVTLTEEEAEKQAIAELSSLKKLHLEGAVISDQVVEKKLSGNTYSLRATYTCVMNIGEEKAILQGGPSATE